MSLASPKASPASASDELLDEAALMAQVPPHDHLVSLIGVVPVGRPLMLLCSYCEHGALKSWLKAKERADTPLDGCLAFADCVRVLRKAGTEVEAAYAVGGGARASRAGTRGAWRRRGSR